MNMLCVEVLRTGVSYQYKFMPFGTKLCVNKSSFLVLPINVYTKTCCHVFGKSSDHGAPKSLPICISRSPGRKDAILYKI